MNNNRQHKDSGPARSDRLLAPFLYFCRFLILIALPGSALLAQGGTVPVSRYKAPTLDDLPMVMASRDHDLLIEKLADGLEHPWSLAFLPNGDMLVTERVGRVRLIRNGKLQPQSVTGTPEVFVRGLAGLMDIALHPRFAQNRLVYLTYNKPVGENQTVALARGRFNGDSFADMQELFVAEPATGGSGRIVFADDGSLFLSVGGAFSIGSSAERAQIGGWHAGKVLRLNEDGSPHGQNPFIGTEGYQPEIFSLGHRNQQGLAIHPQTGELWAHEHAVQGGDELNIIRPGGNYGWPLVSLARDYEGPRLNPRPWQPGIIQPEVLWIPSIAPSGLLFYTGDSFPAWQGDAFVGALRVGRVFGTGHLERIIFNDNHEEIGREWLLEEFGERIREVKQGPDGLLYLLTEAENGALLRLSPQ